MTAVSGEAVTDIAAKGMTKPLTRAEQKAVCGSVLRQAEDRVDQRKVGRAYKSLKAEIQQPPITPTSQDRLVAKLEKLGALLFPAKS